MRQAKDRTKQAIGSGLHVRPMHSVVPRKKEQNQ